MRFRCAVRQPGWVRSRASEEKSRDGKSDEANAYVTANGDLQLGHHFRPLAPRAPAEVDAANENRAGDVLLCLAAEMLILHMLMQGASNKVIAGNWVITEFTVKVRMALLLKLRLQNQIHRRRYGHAIT